MPLTVSCAFEIYLSFDILLQIIFDDIKNLQEKQTTMASRSEQYKRKYLELSHRVLQVRNLLFN